MCESCQRPASNGIIVPRDSGPLTTSALEKSQKQTAQCKQEQPGAAVQGQSSQVRGPAAEAASAAPGRDQAARRPQHDPPRRSGTVGAARSLPVLHGLGSPVQAAVLSVEKSCKGPPDSPESGPRSAAFPCRALSWSSFQARRMQSLTHSRECLGLQICIFPPPPGQRAGRTRRRGGGGGGRVSNPCQVGARWGTAGHRVLRAVSSWSCEAAWRFVYYLLDKGSARRMWIFKAICFTNIFWDPKEIESSGRWREPLLHARVPLRAPQREAGD